MRTSSLPLAAALVAALALAACDGGPGPDLADGPILPLDVGNTWTYEADGEPALRLTVGQPVDVEGEPYFALRIAEGNRTSDEYARAVGDDPDPLGAELLYLAPISGGATYREATVYRYPIDGGTYVDGGRTYRVARERVTVPAGTFEVVTYSGYDGDPTVSASFAPGVGIVRFFDGSDARVLADYTVR